MVNKVILIGRVGRDAELKYTPNGTPVVKFSVATSEKFKDRNGDMQETTEWHNIVAWQKLAEICGQYVYKGMMVFVEGKIQSRQYEDRSGNKRTSFEIVAREVKFLSKKEENEGGGHSTRNTHAEPEPPGQTGVPQGDEITDEDIPF